MELNIKTERINCETSGEIICEAIGLRIKFSTSYYFNQEAEEGNFCEAQFPVDYKGTVNGENVSIRIDGNITIEGAHKRFLAEIDKIDPLLNSILARIFLWIPELSL